MLIDPKNPLHPIHEYKRRLPFRLIKFKCFKCSQPGWIADFLFTFECKKCGQSLMRSPGPIIPDEKPLELKDLEGVKGDQCI